MRTFLKTIKFLIVDGWQSRGGAHIPVDDSLARTIKETSHVTRGSGAASAPRGRHLKQAIDGHRNYQKSFDKKERPR